MTTLFKTTRRNASSALLIMATDEAGKVLALISAGPQGAFDRADQDRLTEWLRKACEQFEAVNPDEPFPKAKPHADPDA
jgi:hypothetical protein